MSHTHFSQPLYRRKASVIVVPNSVETLTRRDTRSSTHESNFGFGPIIIVVTTGHPHTGCKSSPLCAE